MKNVSINLPLGLSAEAWLAAIIESSTDAIASKDLNGIVTSWNRSAERLFGYAAEEMIGKPIAMLAPPGREAEMARILDRVRRGEWVEPYETVRRRKDGRLIDISLTVSPIRDASGRIVGASKIARDISERKRAEAALRASEQRFRELANRVPVFVWFAGPDGDIRFVSQRWCAYTGLTEAETLGTGWVQAIHPDDRERMRAAWRAAREQMANYETEFRCRGADGSYRWVLTRAEPVHDETGQITGWFGTSTDIHDRKLAEQYRRFLMAELDHRVKNILATVLSIARRTLPPGAATAVLAGRLAALARTHDLLARGHWEGASLHEIIRAELTPYLSDGQAQRVAFRGEEVVLRPKTAQVMTMAVHELATNAAKYGALAVPDGRIDIAWTKAGDWLRLEWRESGVPGLRPPDRQGFGCMVIERGVAYELQGRTSLEFGDDGLRCVITFPVAAPGAEPIGVPEAFDAEPRRGEGVAVGAG